MKKAILIKLGPRFTARLLAAVLSFTLCIGIYHFFLKAPKADRGEAADQEKLPNDQSQAENIDSEKEQTDDKTPSVQTPPKEDTVKGLIYNDDNAEEIGAQLSSAGAMLCSNAKNTVISKKSDLSPVPISAILSLTAALTVAEAAATGEISPTERAVCPASAIRLPCYQQASYIFSVGQALTVAELVKCMFCAPSELFAYTLAIHICGEEHAFVNRMNETLKRIGVTYTRFTSVSNTEAQTTNAKEAAAVFRAAMETEAIFSILSSRACFNISAGGNAWNTVTLCNKFYSECCTEGQAKADGIICGYYFEADGKQYAYMMFEQNSERFITVALSSYTAYADSLLLLSRAVR